mmetsp:Transcript_6193/g.5601  ORF Transcript_6193/g.5601 Transcript_6193/m.5601 type:complete len:115 (+) Transcript_6193:508-852(+)
MSIADEVIPITNNVFDGISFGQVRVIEPSGNMPTFEISGNTFKGLTSVAFFDCKESSEDCFFTFNINSVRNTYESGLIELSTGNLTMETLSFEEDNFGGDGASLIEISKGFACD